MEKWRKVPGFQNYEISIDTPEGRCRNTNWQGKIRELKNKEGNNYIIWELHNKSEEKVQQAARWIALTYPELVQNEYFEGAEIDHIDGNRRNNHPSNLRWCTHTGNLENPITKKRMREAGKTKIFTEEHRKNMSKSRKGKYINHPSFSKPVLQKDLDGNIIAEYPSAAEASRTTGIRLNAICDCCRKRVYKGKRYLTAGGFKWEYKEKED